MPSFLSLLFICLFPASWTTTVSPLSVFTQQASTVTLSGTILDADTQKPIAYASVGVLNEAIGTISSDKGTFTLTIPSNQKDKTLRVSAIGFEAQELKIQELLSGGTSLKITLKAQPVELAEVQVKAKNWKTKELGGNAGPFTLFHHAFVNSTLPLTQNLGKEVGLYIGTENKATFLSKLNFCLTTNQFDEVKFRVNLYAVQAGQPTQSLTPQDIIITVKNKQRGWIQADLEPYNLYLNQDFVISLEWIDCQPKQQTGGLTLAASMPGFQTSFHKRASQDKWARITKVGMGLNVEVQRAH
ncbi:hypothetical protein TH61_11295 [Rufibacter sp. DG15C]|uniref:carboxypeptidase-like regulatory domain-containing protein n=1 Tax=Rufibacter sp. DG15C TaxID=1379909 RepID=UPI00078E1585|nr:carboxypeptidase-like regulatory domain-containing protein [Rufibacter sp. DG15C]AMM51642.1 hypothetical protein TH61_11295 [Rufibacter sp. DG15C]